MCTIMLVVTDPRTIRRLIGVYDADGSVLGELSYFLRARVGLAHCALCDITHGRVRERDDWRACRDALPVPFETFQLDDESIVVLATGDDLEACAGSPERLADHLQRAAERDQLVW
jgi:hypothetical protein